MVTSSAMETEVSVAFYNAKDGLPFRTTLEELGHPQPPTPLEVDNETAIGFLNSTMKQRHSKAIDMRFHWVRDRVSQKQFLVYWRPGNRNVADYVSKHHSPKHHKAMRSKFFINFVANSLSAQPHPSPAQHFLSQALNSLQRGCDRSRNRLL